MKADQLEMRAIPLFDGLGEEESRTLLSRMDARERRLQRGELLQPDWDRPDRAALILSGSVHMLKEDPHGHNTLIAYLGPGEMLAESFTITHQPEQGVSFCAACDTVLLLLDLSCILLPGEKEQRSQELLMRNLCRLVGESSLRLMERIEVSSKPSLREKILAYLALLARKQGQKYISVPLNRTEMAAYLQSNRSAMTRELAEMKAEDLIDYDGNTFVLK